MFGLREWVDQGLLPCWQDSSVRQAPAAAMPAAQPTTVSLTKRGTSTASGFHHAAPFSSTGGTGRVCACLACQIASMSV